MSLIQTVAVLSKVAANTSGESCCLHRIYKISTGKISYIGQTNRFPSERFKEHARESSKCTLLKEAIKNYTGNIKLETLAVVGSHQVDTFERVIIAMEDTMTPNGLNMTPGGPGVRRRDDKYDKLRHDISFLRSLISTERVLSYDILVMKGVIQMTEEEFKVVNRMCGAVKSK